MDWLEKIRNKPERERKKFVWIGAFLCTFFIFLIWWFVPSPRAATAPAQVVQTAPHSGPSFNDIKENTVRAYDNFKAQISTVKKSIGF